MEETYEDTKARVVYAPGVSGESKVNVAMTQGSALSPLLFIAIVELISRKICTKDIHRKLLFADDLAVLADEEANLQEQLIEWKYMFSRHGLRVSLEKMEVMWVGHRRKELEIQFCLSGWSDMWGWRFASLNKKTPLGCGLDIGVGVQMNRVVYNG